MKSRTCIAAAVLGAFCFIAVGADAGQLVLSTEGNQFASADWTINIDYISLAPIKEPSPGVRKFEFIVYFDVKNNGDHDATFNSQDDLTLIAGGNTFSDKITATEDYYPNAKEIEPRTTQTRDGMFIIPRTVVKDFLILHAKTNDIKVHLSKLGSSLPFGVSYGGPKDWFLP
jgi:hypothetical protein